MSEKTETTEDTTVRRSVDYVGEVLVITEHYGTKTEGNVSIIREERYDLTLLPENIYIPSEAGRHGMKQKLVDVTASMSEKKGYSTDDRFGLIGELWAQLTAGSWNKEGREGGGAKLSQVKIKGMMEALGLTEEQYAIAVKMGLIKA